MKKLLLITSCCLSLYGAAQTSTLKIEINLWGNPESKDFNLYLLRGTDTVYSKTAIPEDDEIGLDSLQGGDYTAFLYEENVNGYVMKKHFTIEEGKHVSLVIAYRADDYTSDAEDDSDPVQKTEFQLGLGYFHSPWEDRNAMLRGNFYANYTVSAWLAFSKHVGLLMGSGFGASQHYFHKDAGLFENIPFQKVFERYASLTMNYELKMRFSTGDQKSKEMNSQKFFVDLGANYNLPIVFNHTAMYRGSKKLVERDIHNFTDFRAFVNIGFAPVTVFLEYRLSNFIKKDMYPQVSRFNAGVKFMISGE